MILRVLCVSALWYWLCLGADSIHAGHGAPTASGVHSLDVFTDGRALHLLVAEYSSGTNPPALLYQRSADAGRTWSKPVRVDTGAKPPRSPSRGMDAQIAAVGKNLIALWGTHGEGYMGSGPMVTALSDDGGKTWRPGPNPADDGLNTGHAYADLASDSQGALHLVWLDSRDGKQGLRYARSTDGGRTWSKNLTLKKETCECCWNTLAVSGNTVHVLFRDKSPRDMAMVSSFDGGLTWGKPAVAGGFGWEFQGCPHVGGGLALPLSGEGSLHALVWTGLAEKSGVYHLRSTNRGTTWQPPQRIGPVDARRSDIAVRDRALVAALEIVADGESAVFAAKSVDGGVTWSAPQRLSASGVSASYPRVIAVRGGFRVFWTEAAPQGVGKWNSARF